MRYIKSMICAAAAAMLTLTGCTGDQALPPLNMPPALGDATIGDGEWDSPLSAYQAALGTVPHDDFGLDKTEAWVTGYIVGWANVDISSSNIELSATFTAEGALATNLLIASKSDETDPAYVASVQLPSGAVRTALNLKDNPDNLGKLVTVYGTVGSKYCGAYGVRTCTDYNWGSEGKEPDPNMILPSGSINVYNADLMSDLNGFTFDQNGSFETWTHSSQYGLVATGGHSGSAAATDSWAISPVIDLTSYESPRMMVHQAANYFNNTAGFYEMTRTVVREVGGEWENVDIPYGPAGNSWTFSYTGYIVLDRFAGKKIEIGFNYTSTPQVSGTWEIDKLTVTGIYRK